MRDERLRARIRRAAPGLSEASASEIAGVVERLVTALRPERVYLFGSQTRGEATPESDVDLLLVVPSAAIPSHRLAQAAYRAAAPYTCSLDILVMPRDEFERRSRAVASLPAAVVREGRVLYAA